MIPGIFGCLEVSNTLEILKKAIPLIREQCCYFLYGHTPSKRDHTSQAILIYYKNMKIKHLLSTSVSYIRTDLFCFVFSSSAMLCRKAQKNILIVTVRYPNTGKKL